MGKTESFAAAFHVYLGSKRSDGYAHLCLHLADCERIFLIHTATGFPPRPYHTPGGRQVWLSEVSSYTTWH